MFTDEEPATANPQDTWLETSIGYHGAASGTLTLRCPRAFTILLAANLLGIEVQDDDADHTAEDAAKEFMNIVCGQFITSYYGPDPVFDLTIPNTRELYETDTILDSDESRSSLLTVDGYPVQLSHDETHGTSEA